MPASALTRAARSRRRRSQDRISGRIATGADRCIIVSDVQPLQCVTRGHAAIRDLFRASHDRAGNLPLLPAIFPDQVAPIVRVGSDNQRELVMARWGMPGPPQFGGAPITNIRNVKSAHWRRWLGKGSRCIVPATSFCE
jgi:hypothetical protein